MLKKIKKIRELKNWTQESMAKKLNLSLTAYNNLETGKTEITFTRIQEIAYVFQIHYSQLLDFDEKFIFKNNKIENSYVNGVNSNCVFHNLNYPPNQDIVDLKESIQQLATICKSLAEITHHLNLNKNKGK